jgi:hypothetical protein
VWDQDRELIEIQMPGDTAQADSVLENDTDALRLPRDSANNDPNPHFGRVVYIHGLELDRPIAITRYNYVDFAFGQPYKAATVGAAGAVGLGVTAISANLLMRAAPIAGAVGEQGHESPMYSANGRSMR